jgi:hypothetical protein
MPANLPETTRPSTIRLSARCIPCPLLISLWIGKAVWTRDDARGRIDGVNFQNIRATAKPLRVELKGYDEQHLVENVLFREVRVNGQPLAVGDVKTNAFVRNVRVEP